MACGLAVAVAGSRIHLGFHRVPHRAREWAGAGIYLDAYHTIVRARPSSETSVEPRHLEPLIARALEAAGLPPSRITVESHAPRHVGLGSTTQLVLASIAAAYTIARGSPPPRSWIHWAARLAGRGGNGWVGTLLFTGGGIVACSGEPRPLYQSGLPEDWRVVLLLPRLPRGVPEGPAEERIMAGLPPAGERILSRMERGLYNMLLGLARRDVDLFNWGLQMVQNATGEYFRGAQGGVYRGDLQAIVDEAWRSGIVVGQSSWGPTLYTVTTRERAESDAKTLRMIARLHGVEASVSIVRPRNMPATVWCEEPAHT